MDRDCAHCGRPLGAGKTLGRKAKYCSDVCRSAAGNARRSDARVAELEALDRKCEHCGDTFGSAGHLNRHIKTVHDKRRDHKCPHCGDAFGEARTLTKHIERKH